jgi:putative CocE/NonD family hydrolase
MHFSRLSLIFACLQPILCAQGNAWIRENYAKREFQVPMRDGVRLFTAVYTPKDTSRTYPFLITRSPYSASPYGEDRYPARLGPSAAMAHAGYIFVQQDVRGRYMSEGTFSEMRPQLEAHSTSKDIDESTDTYDTIDWLLKNIPGNNGRAGLTGTSYPGFYAAAGLLCGHPALKAVSPQAPMVDLFLGDDNAHNGAFYLAANFGFYRFFGEHKEPQLPRQESEFEFGTEDGYAFYLALGPLSNGDEMYYKYRNRYFTDLLKHTSYDSFWQARSLTAHIHDVQPAVLAVGGWYDAEDLQGPLKLFLNAFTRNPKAPVSIVMGPWVHGGWHGREGNHLGPVEFGQNTSTFFQESIETPFFEKWLRDGQDPKLPVAWMFETGRNQWLTFNAWPPPAAQKRTLYFLPSGGLGFDPPQQNDGFDQYVSDPSKPVPATSFIAQGMAQEYMVDDQRYAERRPDVVAYQTPPLDHDVTLAGPIGVRLDASTSGTDSDFVVKLIDVYPANAPAPSPNPAHLHMGGYEQLVRGEPFRGRFWKSFTRPEPLPSNQFVEIRYDMPDVLHTFKQGHRIMVQVQSSWFPVVDRNPQKFVESIPFAKPADFQSATQRIGHSAAEPSRLEVLVLE